METCEPLVPGAYAFCDHTLLLDGVVRDVFVGKWVNLPNQEGRHLYKYPRGTSVSGGALMCIIDLKRALDVAQFSSVRRDGIHPVITTISEDLTISSVLVTAELASTLPNGM